MKKKKKEQILRTSERRLVKIDHWMKEIGLVSLGGVFSGQARLEDIFSVEKKQKTKTHEVHIFN